MNRKQFMGIVTVSLIVGGTIYAIKKYKDSQSFEEHITLEEARALVRIREEIANESAMVDTEDLRVSGSEEDEVHYHNEQIDEEISELIDEARDEASFNSSFISPNDQYDFYDGLDYTRPLSEYINEEDKALRFNPNTIQARDHFIKMELAELAPNSIEYQIMKRLFDFNFEPLNDGDEILYSQLYDHRVEFFGLDSRWNDNVSFADIITHYARLTDFELGDGIGHWIIHFVHHTDFSELAASTKFDEDILKLNQHKFNNPRTNTYSIFGLTYDDLFDAEEMAEDTVDGEVTYEIEYNTFLKAIMEGR